MSSSVTIYSAKQPDQGRLKDAFCKLADVDLDSTDLQVNVSPEPLKDFENPFDCNVNFAMGIVSLASENKRSCKIFLPDEGTEALATLVVFHGYGEHTGRYLHVGDFFTQRGLRVVMMDHAFHGNDPEYIGWKIKALNNFDVFYQDAASLITKVSETFSDKPVFALGHSMGGLITANAALLLQNDAEKLNFRGVVFSGPAFALDPTSSSKPVRVLLKGLSKVAPGSKQAGAKGSLLSHVPEVARCAKQDPLNFGAKISTKFAHIFMQASMETLHFKGGKAKDFKLPFIIFQGMQDKVVNPRGSELFYERSTIEDKKIVRLENCFHESMNEDLETRTRVMQEMFDWVAARV